MARMRNYKAATISIVDRCDECRFWVLGEQSSEQSEMPADERQGGCHRYAPRPTTGNFESRILDALWLMARDDDLESWDEVLYPVSWPITEGQDFCGEFRRK
jgi:hypothetical protein